MAPKLKRTRTDESPSKSATSSKAKGKRRASSPSRVDYNDGPDGDDDDDEPQQQQQQPSFVTASSGDAYLIASASTSKTSDTLLSSFLSPPFTLSSFASTLATFDSSTQPALVAQREAIEAKEESYELKFPKWRYELSQGYSILLYGFGSKHRVVQAFADEARKRGNVVLVNGFDATLAFADVISALEELVRATGEGGEETTRGRKSPRKGKGKATKAKVVAGAPVAPAPVSALEGRVRRLVASLPPPSKTTKPLYLLIHSLDGPAFRNPKTLSLLSLLSSHPSLHLLASVSHIRSPLLFPTSLATARPGIGTDQRSLNLLYHACPTLRPSPLTTLGPTLSLLLPPSLFPLPTTTTTTQALSPASATHVLASVSARSRTLFSLLSTSQLSHPPSHLLSPPSHTAAPPFSTLLNTLKGTATDRMVANSNEQVEALLAEFVDHGVVRRGLVPPVGREDEDDGGEWVWIPLGREDLEEVAEELEE